MSPAPEVNPEGCSSCTAMVVGAWSPCAAAGVGCAAGTAGAPACEGAGSWAVVEPDGLVRAGAVVGTWSETCGVEGVPAPGSGAEPAPEEVPVGSGVWVRSAGAVEAAACAGWAAWSEFGGLELIAGGLDRGLEGLRVNWGGLGWSVEPESLEPELRVPEPTAPDPMDSEPVDPVGPRSVDPETVDPEPADPASGPAETEPLDPAPADPEPADPEFVGALELVRGVTRTRAGLPMKPKVDGTGSSRTSMSTWSERRPSWAAAAVTAASTVLALASAWATRLALSGRAAARPPVAAGALTAGLPRPCLGGALGRRSTLLGRCLAAGGLVGVPTGLGVPVPVLVAGRGRLLGRPRLRRTTEHAQRAEDALAALAVVDHGGGPCGRGLHVGPGRAAPARCGAACTAGRRSRSWW